MRILFLSAWFPHPPDNGSKIRGYHLLRGLGARHEVTLLSFAFGTAAPNEAEVLDDCCIDVQTVQRDPFAENQTGNLRRFLSFAPVVTRPVPEMSRLVRAALSKTAFDAIVASTETMAAYALQAPGNACRVLEEHNSLTRMMWDRYQDQGSALQRLRCWASWQKTRNYEARLFREFDLVTMVSDQDREVSQCALPGYRGRVEVVPNGVDCRHNRPAKAHPIPNTLVFNGSLTYGANYDAMQYFLGQVYPLIRTELPEVCLTITGSDKGIDLAGLELNDGVRLTGNVDDIRPLVASATVCVAPIRQGGGTRVKILEAMALGTPVVATTKGAEGLQVQNGEHILLANDAAGFADRTLQLLADPTLRQRLATNSRRLVEERYDWKEIGQRFVRLVEEVASNGGVSGT